jgi:hypothetical protein
VNMRVYVVPASVAVAVTFLLALQLIPLNAKAALRWTHWYIGNGLGFSWSPFADVTPKTSVMGVSERCVHGNVYVRFRNNEPYGGDLHIVYAFGPADGHPVPPEHRLDLSSSEPVSEGISVPIAHCDGISKHPYEIFFGAP